MDKLSLIESVVITASGRAQHGFFTRLNGVSTGLYASLNCGYGSADNSDHIAQNRARCAERLNIPSAALVTAHQVHGITVAHVETPWKPGAAPRADAMVTARPGIALGILTADCAPILFIDSDAGVIGAAHAGWKGAKAGVAEATIAAMAQLGAIPSRIAAAIGPTIGAASYEVGPEFRQVFLDDDPAYARFFTLMPNGKPTFDLQGFIAARLERLGLAGIDRIASDTYADPERFFSYRRACHAGESDYGRQLSAIALI